MGALRARLGQWEPSGTGAVANSSRGEFGGSTDDLQLGAACDLRPPIHTTARRCHAQQHTTRYSMCTYLPAFDRYCPVKPTRRMWEYWDLYVDYVMAYLTLKILTFEAETSMPRRSAELSVVVTIVALLFLPVTPDNFLVGKFPLTSPWAPGRQFWVCT